MALVDRREIEFDTEALLTAVATSQRAAESLGLPSAAPDGARFDPKLGAVDLLYGVTGFQRSIRLTAEMAGALLVAYCIRAGIPMPKNANKSISVGAISVTLGFVRHFPEAPKPSAERKKVGPPALATSVTW